MHASKSFFRSFCSISDEGETTVECSSAAEVCAFVDGLAIVGFRREINGDGIYQLGPVPAGI